MSIQYTADQLQRKFHGAPGAGGFARIAEVLREEGRHEEAIALCQEGLRARPGHMTGLLVLGKCLLDMDKLEEAREQFEAVLRQDPRCLSALHLLARIMAKLQWQDAAAAYYRSILELEPWDTETLARLRDLAPNGATASGFVPAPPESAGYSDAAASLAAEPAIEQFDLDSAADFMTAEHSPGDLAGALEEISLEDALSAPSGPAAPFSPPAGGLADLAEPKPMDILPSAPSQVPAEDEEINEPAPISGDDVGERLDSLFGIQDDMPTMKAGPTLPTLPTLPEEGPADATLQMPAFAPESATPSEPFFQAADPSLQTAATGPDSAPEDRISGEDIEDRLDALFSLSEGTNSQPVIAPAPADAAYGGETVLFPAPETAAAVETPESEVPEALEAPSETPFSETPFAEAPFAEAPATAFAPLPELDEPTTAADLFAEEAEPEPVRGAASETAERPAFLGDKPARGPFSSGLESPAAEPPESEAEEEPVPQILHPMPEDVILTAGADAASTALDPDEVITGQDVADKLDALFGGDPAPRAEPVSRAEPAPRGEPARKTPADTGVFPPPVDGLPAGTASWAAARPADEIPGGTDTHAGMATAFEAPQEEASDLHSTVNMLPRGIGSESAPPVTGDDIEDRLDSLFNLGEEGEPSAGTRPATGAESAFLDFPPMPPAEADRTMIMPIKQENASDWLARQSDEEPPSEVASATGGDTLFISNEEVFGAEPEFPAAPSASHGAGDTVGMEMVDSTDIESRLDQIFSPEEAAAQAAKAAAEAAIASGEADREGGFILPEVGLEPTMETGEMPFAFDEEGILAQDSPAPSVQDELVEMPLAGTMVSGDDVNSRLSEIFEAEPRNEEMPEFGNVPATPEMEEPSFEVFPEPEAFPEPDGLMAGAAETGTAETAGMPPVPASGSVSRAPIAPLAPLEDEEGAPEDEENAPQSAAGANVATVTLAEIYFQQGLREQALQIYRQLLEREPGNESVRTRIQEIEASKPEAGPGPGTDPRRPKPGLKVPKRKK